MVLALLFIIASAAVASWCLLRLLIPILRRRFLDQPNARSSHTQPTARGGGVVFVFVSAATSVFTLFFNYISSLPIIVLDIVPLLALPLAFIGFQDDRYSLPSGWRYGAQLATAILVILFSPLDLHSILFLPSLVFLLIAVTAIINFTNFMDGLDGLVAGCMALVLMTSAIKVSAPLPIWALVGALFGFLFWNWSPAKVFMGDVGSTFLGAVFAFLVLQSSSWIEALALLLVATPLVSDACICVPRRLMAGQPVFQAHRLHLFQRLHQAGWPHSRVSLTYIGATAVLAIALLIGGLYWLFALSFLELLLGIYLDQRVAVSFILASKS